MSVIAILQLVGLILSTGSEAVKFIPQAVALLKQVEDALTAGHPANEPLPVDHPANAMAAQMQKVLTG